MKILLPFTKKWKLQKSEMNGAKCTTLIGASSIPDYWRWGWTILWWSGDTKPYSVVQHFAPSAVSQLRLSCLALKPQDHTPPDRQRANHNQHTSARVWWLQRQPNTVPKVRQLYSKVTAKLISWQTISTSIKISVNMCHSNWIATQIKNHSNNFSALPV